jgi:DNA polymerase-4
MKRVIFLVDMNAFFISCEKTRHPEIEGKPAAVAGDPVNRSGIILTANYEARKYGIKTTMIVPVSSYIC